ncbi:matrix-remodeling-associated protein 5-like [Seriola dumerili]|uniref:matrix-remodeling-associated protein 5-like n=1 Tax=Seriola dumerili TaxID=41447 RepID=UPI000BBEFE53|nr:matrix-remodeling-associated protein 5-like [Seriola dumerili]
MEVYEWRERSDSHPVMALWWCAKIFCRLAAAWFPLFFSSLLWQTISPVYAAPSCPRTCSCPGVKEVHCTFRHLTTIPKTFPRDTERLNLGYNSLTEVEGSEFRSLRQLEMLMLHGNDINTVHPRAFYSLRSLQILKLSYNKLTSLNAGLFDGLVGLIRLHLDHNLLDFIEPYSFSGLTSLKLLQLEGNLLKEIHPHTFITVSLLGSFWTSGLKHLHLSDNLLEQLPPAALRTAPRLELLSLHGNPWTCDCQLQWLVEWSSKHEGVIKCKKERGSSETCPQCSSPQPLNATLLLGLTLDKLSCERPALRSPLKQWDNPVWAESEAEPDLPYTRDFEKPLGHLTFVLSDSHGNHAHVACDVRHPGDSSPMTWTVNSHSPAELSVNVSLVTVLECEIDRETLQNLWQLVAYYYESPAILERGQQRGNASRVTYQYTQAVNENSPYFTELKGHLVAEPSWLLQPRVTLRLNRQQTTTKKLVMDFTTLITKHVSSHRGQEDDNDSAFSWALIHRGTAGRIQTALEGSKVRLECSVVTSNPEVKVEWMLPDLSIVEEANDKTEISERGDLVILNATLSDSGLYHCMVRTKAGVDLMPLRLTIKELSLSPTAFNGQKIVVEKGRSLALSCDVTSVQPSQTMWYLPKNQILLPTQQTRRAEVMENGTLVVRKLSQEDAGEYSCLASNLYGVDMLSHMVEVTEEKASDRSKVQTEREKQLLPSSVEEGEGSGGDYQEIKRPFATQFPRRVGTQQRNPNGFSKRIRIKDSKRKPNKSVKELDPNRWAEILAKANSKPSVALPTEQSLEEPSTVLDHTLCPPIDPGLSPTPGLKAQSSPTDQKSQLKQTQTRDQLFLSRLRNRYRQAQLDRIAQLGRMVTPKPRTGYNNPPSPITPKTNLPSLHRPYTPKPPVAADSYTYNVQPPNLAKPSLSSFSGFIPTPRPYLPTTPGVLHGGRWPVEAGRISSRRPTAAPPFPWVLGAGSSGMKPRITTVATASVSVLAESDVFLPCKATGNPEPTIAWTKVSTGATIPANTKHGPRFEVFKNGTFVIKNIQLQDRGQYLCTAQNRFGSDRMVTTLAVQTEAPKIQPPMSTDIAVYLGKSMTLDCLASGKPPAQISWILPDRTFVREVGTVHTLLSPMSLLQNGTLQINSANFSNKGDYKCIASNAAGADTITYHLHVAALPPSISEGAADTVLIQPGRSVYIHCSVKGEPVPALKWMLPSGVHVKPSQFLGRRLFVFPNGTLLVKNISPSDGGRYECLATNTVGIAKRTVQLEVRADSPSFSRQPPPAPLPIPPTPHHAVPSRQHSVSAMYGSAVYLHCPESTGSTRGTIWQLPSKTIMEHRYSPERPIKVFRNGTLRILQLTELDGGNYLCVFQRPNGEDMELFQVEVLMTAPRIEHVRTAQTRVTFGENFQVDCVATGLPDPEVSWSLPDGTLINNALQSDDSGLRNRRYVIFGNGTLLLQQMGKKDEGDYTCYAKNKLGKDERKVNVKVGPNAPKIRSKSQSLMTVKLGESAKSSCQATGDPIPRITWISPRNDVIPVSSDRFQVMDDGTLVVKKVTLADEGKYACVARNSAGDDVKNVKLEVEPQEPFINSMKGKSTTKVLGVSYQTVLLDCRVEGKPEPRVWWVTPYGHSLTTPYLGGRFQVHRNGSLELRGVRKTDEGRYMCLAKNHLGEASLLVELDVASLAEKPSFAVPNIEILPIKQDGRELILECPARGKPHPEFAWVLPNGTMLTPGVRLQRFTHHLGNGTLRISQPVATDKGVYRCLAKNVAGQAEKRYALETGRKPVIRGTTGGMKITYGLNLNLPCTVDGWPQASITWTLPNGLVLDKPQTIGRVSFLANGTLQLRQVATFDKGTYICKAFNSFGSSTLSYPVAVMVFPPRITSTLTAITRVNRGSPVTLNCVATGIPKPDISWTLPGRTTLLPHNRFTVQGGIHMTEEGSLYIQSPVLMNSGIYKCNAKNALGTDFKSTYLQVV